MSEKDKSNNPLEELQKQLNELFNNPSFLIGKPLGGLGDKEVKPKSKRDKNSLQVSEKESLKKIKDFNFKPREIRDYLDKFVIRQDEAKKVLSVAICDHYNHIRECLENSEFTKQEYNKQNILILGPTGVGKTYLMRNIAKLIGVPFVKADATKFTETGYVGGDVEDLVRDLVKAANGNISLAQYGIIYIDEIDKIASAGHAQARDVSGRGVQINLLKLMEESEVNLFSPTDIMSQMQAMMDMPKTSVPGSKPTINTRHILFIVSGAFDKLAEDVKRRVESAQIGFGRNKLNALTEETYPYLNQAQTSDFIKYGFEPEFVGRLPVRVACESLNADDLSKILISSEGSILKQYRDNFKGYNIELNIEEEAIMEIARRACEEKTGARGLLTVLEKVFRDFKYELPSTAIKLIEVNLDTVKDPQSALEKLLTNNQHLEEGVLQMDLLRYIENFKQQYGFKIKLDIRASKALIQEAKELKRTIRSVCDDKFKDLPDALKIIQKNTAQDIFTITKALVANPDKELSTWVAKSFEMVRDFTKDEL